MESKKNTANGQKSANLSDWRKLNRFKIQIAALVLGILFPFGIYWGLQDGQALLAAVSFGLVTFGMLLVLWAG